MREALGAHEEGVFAGPVRWVLDGDTLQVLVRGRPMDVRLAAVDAPERSQPYGWEATLALIDLVRNREVRIAPVDVDRYGRVVAHVYVGERAVARELVLQGAAWFDSRYARNAELYAAEQRARGAKRGLWALPRSERIEPWEWRRRQREPSQPKGSASPGARSAPPSPATMPLFRSGKGPGAWDLGPGEEANSSASPGPTPQVPGP